jgi:hypothetical protein
MDELVIDNLVYIPSKKAAAITGYAKDYVGQLCREGRIEAKLVGRSWYVLESSVREHRFGKISASPSPVPSAPVPESPVTEEEMPTQSEEDQAPASQPLAEEVWESPRYTAEPVEEVFSSSPTYLTNTTDIHEPAPQSQIEEVQSAWQEWFSKNEGVRSSVEPIEEPAPEPVKEVDYEEPQEEVKNEVEEMESAPVQVSIMRTREPVRSVDMVSNQEYFRPQTQSARPARTRIGKSQRKAKRGQNVALKAVFVGLIILTVAVTIIGTGSLEAVNPSWAGNSSAIDYLAGVKSIEK